MYDSSQKYKWDNQNTLNYAMTEGIEKGKLEEALAIARELKKEGLAIEFIAKTTKLFVDVIEKL
ncbi:hypothetical protein [Mucilaginibacter pedocola]|uniref:Transposase n=1 Tax=Mucilaginibacter pedocola TaxID=1792845 RepID=A0A1S9PJ04_9SPHI|nr:hypothetical protein [Mucilaginibacter pedocola]OOQ60934.1 hypothetical protein BC343_23530 [Mucilaginibacter pedocola]